MKKALIGLLALVAILIVAVFIGPSLWDWNSFKPRISAEAEAATGRSLAIDGDIAVSLLPVPTLRASDLRAVAKSKNVPSNIATHAKRLVMRKSGG